MELATSWLQSLWDQPIPDPFPLLISYLVAVNMETMFFTLAFSTSRIDWIWILHPSVISFLLPCCLLQVLACLPSSGDLKLLEFLMTHLVRCLWQRHHPKSHLELMLYIQNASSTSFSVVWREGSHSSESSPYIWPSHLNPKPWFSNWSSLTTNKESNPLPTYYIGSSIFSSAYIQIWYGFIGIL